MAIAKTIAAILLIAVLVWLIGGLIGFGLYSALHGTPWAVSADAARAFGYAMLSVAPLILSYASATRRPSRQTATKFDDAWLDQSQTELQRLGRFATWGGTSAVYGEPPRLMLLLIDDTGCRHRFQLGESACQDLTRTIERAWGRYRLTNSQSPKSRETPSDAPSSGKQGSEG